MPVKVHFHSESDSLAGQGGGNQKRHQSCSARACGMKPAQTAPCHPAQTPPTTSKDTVSLELPALSACLLVTEKMYTSPHYYAHLKRILST